MHSIPRAPPLQCPHYPNLWLRFGCCVSLLSFVHRWPRIVHLAIFWRVFVVVPICCPKRWDNIPHALHPPHATFSMPTLPQSLIAGWLLCIIIWFLPFNILTAIKVPAGTRTPAPWDSCGRNSTESTVDHQHNYPTNIITILSCLSLQRHGFNGSTQSDAGNLFGRGRPRMLWQGFVWINKLTV